MNPECIKPIPKYIVTKIQRQDRRAWPEQKGQTRFYSYLTKIQKELVKITVAVKNHKERWYCKQVAVHGVKSDKCLVRDMEYVYFGYGYRVGWYAEGLYKYKKWYEDGIWYGVDCKYFNPFTVPVNLDYVERFPEYRYSAHQYFKGRCVIEYLRLYKQYPQTEYFLKLGLHKIHDSVTVLKRIAKDKQFCKWLIANKIEISAGYYYIETIMRAYKTGKPLKQVQAFAECKKKLNKDSNLQPLKELFGHDLERFFAYLDAQGSDPNSYLDYLKACNHLGLDMTLPKNRFPHNFKRWHDIRIDEYHTARALTDAEERAELYRQFSVVAEKYTALQDHGNAAYAVLIATSPAELMREGEILCHCVGRMGYDQRMAREESLIFFVRIRENPGVPFVTVEYSLKNKKVLQCYGAGSVKPDDAVLTFVNKVWLPFANKTLKKLAA